MSGRALREITRTRHWGIWVAFLLGWGVSIHGQPAEGKAGLDEALKAYSAGDLDRTLAIVDEILKTDPKDERALKLRKQCLADRGMVQEDGPIPLKTEGTESPELTPTPVVQDREPEVLPLPRGWLSKSSGELSAGQPPKGASPAPSNAPQAEIGGQENGRAEIEMIALGSPQQGVGNRTLVVSLSTERPHKFEWTENQRGFRVTFLGARAIPMERTLEDQNVESFRLTPIGENVVLDVRLRRALSAEVETVGKQIRIKLIEPTALAPMKGLSDGVPLAVAKGRVREHARCPSGGGGAAQAHRTNALG